jgi:protein-S-isoprenylcysteine O-methyltransferase Ste14
LTAVAVIATFIAIRVVVARPQPITTPGLVAIDDAVRTQAVHNLAGAGIAVALLGTSACLFEMGGYASPEWLHITGVIAAFGALAGTMAAWSFRGSPWRVQRTMPA